MRAIAADLREWGSGPRASASRGLGSSQIQSLQFKQAPGPNPNHEYICVVLKEGQREVAVLDERDVCSVGGRSDKMEEWLRALVLVEVVDAAVPGLIPHSYGLAAGQEGRRGGDPEVEGWNPAV